MAAEKSWKGLANALRAELGDGVVFDEPMSRYTTIGVGGPARAMATPRTVEEVAATVRLVRRFGAIRFTLGKGSNLIVRDGGYDGVIIRMGTYLSKITVNKRTVRAGGGASFARMCRNLTRMGRTGMEFGIGIPGTVGGAVRMNAGAFGGEVSRVVRRVRTVEGDGSVVSTPASKLVFSYRHSSVDADAIVVAATFECPPGEIDREAFERSLGRKETQPIDERTFGSTFVNPSGAFAAEMIERCGLKGKRIGGAQISSRHANFIVNPDGKASAADVEALIELMRSKVNESFGVNLKTEVVVIGNR